ncbi:MAG: DNA polymerase [Micrococcales bacterium]|nr:DNA polymerase [Micrococcales bacterium]
MSADQRCEALTALVVGPAAGGTGDARVAIVGPDTRSVLDLPDACRLAERLEARRPRWVWWSATQALGPLVGAGIRPARAWDVAEAHRLLCGGWATTPGLTWAGAHDLQLDSVPGPPTGDLFEALNDDCAALEANTLVRADGHLRPDAVTGTWLTTDDRLLSWADALLDAATAQRRRAGATTGRLLETIYAESAAAMLCVELHHDGLPVDRAALLELVRPMSGPKQERDALVLHHVPGREGTDLRNPAQVRDLLRAVGIDVPSTRKHVLEAFRDAHPIVPALLAWRREERIATTYGLRWIDEHIGPDDRLRGRWTACDGAAGRMTAESGLHNLPAVLRPGIAAESGHVFVRADLGQIEPRVLAVVSGDAALMQATQADDLYAPVAARLGVERAIAKIAVLAAMYGQRSGAAGQALRGLERSYPVAMAHLDRAHLAGTRGEAVRTYGGRLIPTGRYLAAAPIGADPTLDAARGRFARNAVIQGAAAELFKAWAATVRATTRHLDARIVLCLHDELLVHVPREHACQAAAAVDRALADASRRWSGGVPVRFVADTSLIERWSDAKE